jgi:hypothetical protein
MVYIIIYIIYIIIYNIYNNFVIYIYTVRKLSRRLLEGFCRLGMYLH